MENKTNNGAWTPFLKAVARDLRSKRGNDLSRLTVVFPNKRAGLFFNEYLVDEKEESPVWAPRYATISELFASLSALTIDDPIETVCRIYNLYVGLTGSSETLDFFYGWGEKLLSDFDDVDKNMADAHALFQNLSEIKELETTDYLTPEQRQALSTFFKDFSETDNSRIRRSFLSLWNNMYPLYRSLNEELLREGKAYEGALYRDVVDRLERGALKTDAGVDSYVFVGFNVLDKVEGRLFRHLQQEGKALFYWDYDLFYAGAGTTFEAGIFLRKNLEAFPNELPASFFDNLLKDKEIAFYSAATDNIQARFATAWLRSHLTPDAKRTAIVLCNETLLLPVLHSLPPEVGDVNVTKGFPLSHTPAFSLVSRELDADVSCENADNASFLAALAERIKQAALRFQDDSREKSADPLVRQLHTEAFFQAYTVVNRFRQLVDKGSLTVERLTVCRLLKQVLRQSSLPFHGEPAVGLQVMGLLETRNLDFENLLLLSVNEGNLPKRAGSESTFIPPVLRREFGLTTPRRRTAVYAYYFYRLLQRARHVSMVYRNVADDKQKGEMSRFMMQLLVETRLPVAHYALSAPVGVRQGERPSIPKPSDLAARLRELSPSALNAYLRCPLEFYYQRVLRLKEPEPPADVIEPNTFGTLFHRAAELLYAERIATGGGLVTAAALERFLDDGGDVFLKRYVDRAFADVQGSPAGTEINVVVERVLMRYLRQLLEYDKKLAPFKIVSTEKEVALPFPVECGGRRVDITLKGTIDRLDEVNLDGLTRLRIVDYKTGGEPERPVGAGELFVVSEKRPHYVFQTFVYSLIMAAQTSLPIVPSLFFVHKSAGDGYDPRIFMGERMKKQPVLCFQDYAAFFEERLRQLIAEILDPSRPFEPTPVTAFCKNCRFRNLCLC